MWLSLLVLFVIVFVFEFCDMTFFVFISQDRPFGPLDKSPSSNCWREAFSDDFRSQTPWHLGSGCKLLTNFRRRRTEWNVIEIYSILWKLLIINLTCRFYFSKFLRLIMNCNYASSNHVCLVCDLNLSCQFFISTKMRLFFCIFYSFQIWEDDSDHYTDKSCCGCIIQESERGCCVICFHCLSFR